VESKNLIAAIIGEEFIPITDFFNIHRAIALIFAPPCWQVPAT
jgi:hypothetical protein